MVASTQGKLEHSSHEDNSQFYQSSNTIRVKFFREYCQESVCGSSKCLELEGLIRDLTELTHVTQC